MNAAQKAEADNLLQELKTLEWAYYEQYNSFDTNRSFNWFRVRPEEPGSPPPNVALKIAARFPKKEAAHA